MFRQNMGRLDRAVRFVIAVILIPVGLFGLSGWQGQPVGLVVLGVAAIALVTSLTGFCLAYIPLGISTVAKGPMEAGTRKRPQHNIVEGSLK